MQFTNLYALLMRLSIITFVIQALDNNQVSFYNIEAGSRDGRFRFIFFYSVLINVHLMWVVFSNAMMWHMYARRQIGMSHSGVFCVSLIEKCLKGSEQVWVFAVWADRKRPRPMESDDRVWQSRARSIFGFAFLWRSVYHFTPSGLECRFK